MQTKQSIQQETATLSKKILEEQMGARALVECELDWTVCAWDKSPKFLS